MREKLQHEDEPESFGLPPQDLNLAYVIQSHACCRYTRGQRQRNDSVTLPDIASFWPTHVRTCVRRIQEAGGAMGEHDWDEIKAFYWDGHTIQECAARFKFSSDDWDRAVAAGKVVPRFRTPPKRHATREAVAELLAAGHNQAEVAFRLRLSRPTVSYHARRLGIPRNAGAARRYDWDEIQSAYDGGLSRRECQLRFGFSSSAWCDAVAKGKIVTRPRGIPIDDLLVAGSRRGRGHIRSRILKAGLKEERCERCGLSEWRGQSLSVTLHHINGDGYDHRLENIEFLCPNCHSQTSTFSGRNGHLRPADRHP